MVFIRLLCGCVVTRFNNSDGYRGNNHHNCQHISGQMLLRPDWCTEIQHMASYMFNWAFNTKISEKSESSWVHEGYHRMEVHVRQLKNKKVIKFSLDSKNIPRVKWGLWDSDFFEVYYYNFDFSLTIFHDFQWEYPFSHNSNLFFSQFRICFYKLTMKIWEKMTKIREKLDFKKWQKLTQFWLFPFIILSFFSP